MRRRLQERYIDDQRTTNDSAPSRPRLPTGTVTFLFTDVEGSTRLLHSLGAGGYAEALADHRRLLREAFTRHDGVEVDTQGDGFFVAFPTAPGALAAAREAQQALASGPIRVRMGLHTGTPVVTPEGYVGPDVHRAARIAAAGHGGQVLVSSATAALLRPDGLRDLGEHRLKDLSAVERIYQLGEGRFPPLKTLYQTNLPVATTSFLGRERELAELSALIARHDVRLVTLTGPGGTGKTRLALQAAGASAEHFPDGVWWVPLASLRDPTVVLPTAAGVLGASGDLAEHIADMRMLLLFDNFEQVIEAADELGALLARCPNVRVLVTSRELLQLPGEQAYPVPPLEPDEGQALFLVRARAAKPGFTGDGTVAELCTRLDNLPLAIELAAARVRMLSPEQLLDRLGQRLDLLKGGRGVDARQQTLRATIEWSYELLNEDEQRLFARLAVFRGGWTLGAAEAICDANLEVLQSLVDKSLVRVRDERFSMLETMREFATERLAESGELDQVQRRHVEHFADFAERAQPQLTTNRQSLDLVELEHGNIRAALRACIDNDAAGPALGMGAALWRFWQLRGHLREGRGWLAQALALPAAADPSSSRAAALAALAGVAYWQQEYEAAERHYREALDIYQALRDRRGEAEVLYSLAYLEVIRGAADQALELYERSAAIWRELGNRVGEASASQAVGMMKLGAGRPPGETVEPVKRAVETFRQVGERFGLANSLHVLAMALRQNGLLEEAIAASREALGRFRDDDNGLGVAMALGGAAAILAAQGRHRDALRLGGAAAAIEERLGGGPPLAMRGYQDVRSVLAAALPAQEIERAWWEGRELAEDEACALAFADVPSGAG